MRRMAAIALGTTLLLTACGGADEAATPPRSDNVEPPAPTAAPGETGAAEETPDSLAMSESEVLLRGDTGALVAPGEAVVLDHLVYNDAPGPRSMRIQVLETDLDVTTDLSSVRLGAGESVEVSTTVQVPADAAVGEVLSFEMVAVMSDDISQRATQEVRLLVADPAGERPEVANAVAETATNEKVVVYLFGAASDVDGDLDVASLRVVGGGFRSSDVVTGTDGTITYFPFQNVVGEDKVLFEICDGEGRCDTGTLTIDVNG